MNKFGWAIVTTSELADGNVASGTMLRERIIGSGGKTFFPQERYLHFYHGQRIEKLRPLFPGYVFVDVRGEWRGLLEVKGVAGFLMNYAESEEDNYPIIVSQETIDDMRVAFCLDANDVVIPSSVDRFKKGQRVMAKAGPMKDYIGTYDHLSGHREWVEFSVNNKRTRAHFAIGELLPVESM